MKATPVRMPESAVPQFWDAIVHALVITIVVLAASVTGVLHVVHENTVGNVYTAAIGYAAGRAGSVVHRTVSARKADNSTGSPQVDSTG